MNTTAAFETWSFERNQLTGFGVALQGKDTVFVEKLKIISEGADLFYVADVVENPQPVRFRFTEMTDTGFICENLNHDFPKRIEYQRSEKILEVTISGDGRSVDFIFEKRN